MPWCLIMRRAGSETEPETATKTGLFSHIVACCVNVCEYIRVFKYIFIVMKHYHLQAAQQPMALILM